MRAASPRALLTAALLPVFLNGCSSGPDPFPGCQELVAAAPTDWARLLPDLAKLDKRAVPALIRALAANPDGAGRQAAVQLLANWPNERTRTFLEELIEANDPQAAEAALALGRMASKASHDLLARVATDPLRPVLLRTCAAASLIDLGDARSAWPLVRAVLLAATPHGVKDTKAQGLPKKKTRWAHERYILLEAMRRFSNGKLFGLDEDAPWPKLRDGVQAYEAFLTKRQKVR